MTHAAIEYPCLPAARQRRSSPLRGFCLSVLVLAWIGVTTGGALLLWRHANTPAAPAAVPAIWPAESRLPRRRGQSILVMFAHPKCPCTRSSLRELERLVAQNGTRLDLIVCFVQPAGQDEPWARSQLWQHASLIPGVQVLLDPLGEEAARFGATTSGQALLYDSGGRLMFQGGITPARGHEGDNAGRAAVLALSSGRAAPASTPAYGCSLQMGRTD